MKTTLDIPDAPCRRLEMEMTRNGETVRNVTLAFVAGRAVGLDGNGVPQKDKEPELPAWAALAAPCVRKRLDGPRDKVAIRRSILRVRQSMRSR